MYKVFIDNSILFIASSLENVPEIHQIIDFDKFSFSLLNNNKLPVKNSVLLHDNPERVFKTLFKDYEKIDAAGGIVKREDEYLFIKRHGFWDIPKGKVEKNEPIELAAVREIEEECGISKPRIDHKLCTTLHTYQFKGKDVLKTTHWFLLFYEGDEVAVPQLEEDITEVRWFRRHEFQRILENTYPSIHDVLAKL